MEDFKKRLLSVHQDCGDCPSNDEVIQICESTISLLYPHFKQVRLKSLEAVDKEIESIRKQAHRLFSSYPKLCPSKNGVGAEMLTESYIAFIPKLYDMLNKDVEAIYAEDPAAHSREIITRSYPGFYAIAAYRIAHWLEERNISLIPRIITEYAHARTGIDIHPAAQIGEYFCIDHGTGVVIGETTIIGNQVKIYQGVTLGALSISKDQAYTQRHPTIEDNVVIYANATILGGDTIIGEGSVIGGNVWITESVAPYSKVYYVSDTKQIIKK